jgi:hypothetical protein
MPEQPSGEQMDMLLDAIIDVANEDTGLETVYPEDHWRELMIQGKQLTEKEQWDLMMHEMERARFRLASHQLIMGFHLLNNGGGEVILLPHLGADMRARCFEAYTSIHPA